MTRTFNVLSRLTFGLLIAAASSAQASVSGNWSGSGEWTYQGRGTECSKMSIHFEDSAGEFKRVSGFFDCGIVALHSDPFSWTKNGSELFFNGKKAGRVSDVDFETTEPYGDDVTIQTTFEAEGGNADYQEVWRGKDGKEIYLIKGRLTNTSF
jgi:hypothetical protein